MNVFDRSQHVYVSPDLDKVVKDTIRFFNGTPVHSIPISERFHGTGVYALYCIAKSGIYSKFHSVNRTEFRMPIYVGKAVPKGWRQSRLLSSMDTKIYELNNRIKEHSRSIDIGDGLNISDFFCRFMILEGKESDLIGTVEGEYPNYGVPGGENMIRYPNGQIRYYTTFEAKRIQTFPDDYKIWGSWTEAMRQIGNAVPVELGHHIVSSLAQTVCV